MSIVLSTGKEINLRDSKTRKIDREYTEALAEGVFVGENGIQQFPAKNMQRANDILVMGMARLSQNEVDDLTSEEFSEILAEIEKLDQKKSQVNDSTEKSSGQ